MLLLAVFLPLMLSSCQRESDKPVGRPPPSAIASDQLIVFAKEELSEVGGYLPVLDEGRVQLAPPVDWYISPRSKDYLVRFVFDRRGAIQLPRITVQARDAAAYEPRRLDRDNLSSFVDALLGRMDEQVLRTMDRGVDPLMLGSIPCARYVVRKKYSRGGRFLPAECEVLVTIRGGRVYTVILDANEDTLVDFRADAYAVMANMRFPLDEEADGHDEAGITTDDEAPPEEEEAATPPPADGAEEQAAKKDAESGVSPKDGA